MTMAAVSVHQEESAGPFCDIRLSAQDFRRLADFINRYSGIKIPPSKKTMVEGRLRRRLRSLNLQEFDGYCHYLFEEGGLEDETLHIIDAITTNKTDFFREPKQFQFLADVALPNLMAHRHRDAPLKLWSAACSCGAEPYTMAMVVEEFARLHGELRYGILASDLCVEMLEQAARAIYREEMVEPVPLELRKRYMLRSRDRSQGEVRITPALRRKVNLTRLNFMDDSYAVPSDFDVIFCRNVLIYFDKAVQAEVLAKLCSHLVPGGYLFLGHSESIAGMALPLTPVGPTIFMRS